MRRTDQSTRRRGLLSWWALVAVCGVAASLILGGIAVAAGTEGTPTARLAKKHKPQKKKKHKPAAKKPVTGGSGTSGSEPAAPKTGVWTISLASDSAYPVTLSGSFTVTSTRQILHFTADIGAATNDESVIAPAETLTQVGNISGLGANNGIPISYSPIGAWVAAGSPGTISGGTPRPTRIYVTESPTDAGSGTPRDGLEDFEMTFPTSGPATGWINYDGGNSTLRFTAQPPS